jgi:hypothetical protein
MEASINGVHAGSTPPRRPEPSSYAPARRAVSETPAATSGPTVELAAWFDRNGDGHIDTTTWVLGGDAYIRVDKSVSEVLDRAIARPRDKLAAANEAAVNAYRKYGADVARRPHSA